MRCCGDCNLAREVELFDGARILVCDGGSDEMARTCPLDLCGEFEPLLDGDAR